MSSDELVSTIRELAEVLQTQRTLGAALASIAEAATVSVPGCDAASIAISLRGQPATAAISAAVALELDMVQYDTGEGPCLTAFRTMDRLRVDLFEQGEDFPHFAVAARQAGMRGVLSLPAVWGNSLVGTLNLYSRTSPFDETSETVAEILAAQVAIAISRSPEFAAARTTLEQAQRDSDDQAHINVATGLLMVNEACTAEQAEGLLRRAAANDAQTIVAIAHRIIEQNRSSR